ncbi:MAG: hypothetical protein ACRCT6_03020 [Notoacmeibacter sp.]
MKLALATRESTEESIKAYKALLSAIIDKRPSDTRQRLADALGKHRSFITQMTGVSYPTPVPERHLATIFSICHFSQDEQRLFLMAYDAAHPDRVGRIKSLQPMRALSIMVEDLQDDDKNRKLDEAIAEFVRKVAGLISGGKA